MPSPRESLHSKFKSERKSVAATESPIVFLGTGEHMDDLDSFDAQSFVQKLLGMGNMKELMSTFSVRGR